MNLEEIFDKHDDEYLKFDRIKNKLSSRPDLHAFLVLDKLFPGKRDMVCAAEHDEIWLDVDTDKAETIEESVIIDLVRCGVRYDDECDCLAMFA